MHEIEAKILDIDINQMISKLEKLGVKPLGEKLLKYYVINKNDTMIRIRTDGSTVTLTAKWNPNPKNKEAIKTLREIEVELNGENAFEDTVEIFKRLGYNMEYFEKRRIGFKLGDVKVEIDEYKGRYSHIPPFLEIEGKSIQEVVEVCNLLGYKKEDLKSFNVYELDKIYAKK